MKPTLVAVDFSGTLSPGSAAFGKSERLLSTLRETGWEQLWSTTLRAETSERFSLLDWFWRDIIAPTWQQGGTSPIGYRNLLCQRLAIVCDAPPIRIETCVAAFTEQYWAAAIIDPPWIPFLHHLTIRPEMTVLIATDHYAEATEHILNQLARHGLSAVSLLTLDVLTHRTEIVVANSADIGHFKATQDFWQIVKDRLPSNQWSRILVIDDFGANEASQDAYALPEQVNARQEAMVAMMRGVFKCEANIIFMGNGLTAARNGAKTPGFLLIIFN